MTTSIATYPPETVSGAVTTWLPLTTAYASNSAASCTGLFRQVSAGLLAYDPGYGSTIDRQWNCMPSAASTWWSYFADGPTYPTNYGIGPMTCPENWSTVQTSVKNDISTLAMCCPSGYGRGDGSLGNPIVSIVGQQPDANYAFGCASAVTLGDVVSYVDLTAEHTTTFTAASRVYALAIVGVNRAEAMQTSTAATATGNVSQSATSSSTSTSTPTAARSGLSTGAIAGISVGVALVVLAIIGLMIAVAMLYRKKKNNYNARENQPDSAIGPTSGYMGNIHHTRYLPKAELSSTSASQTRPRAELDGTGYRS